MNNNILKLIQKSKYVIISYDEYKNKVSYALDNGIIFLIKKEEINTINEKELKFEIPNDKIKINGSGKLSIVGDPLTNDHERSVLLYKNPENILLLKCKDMLIVKLITDETTVNNKKFINLNDVNEKQHPVIRSMRPWSFQQSIAAIILGSILAYKINVIFLFLTLFAVLLSQGSFNILNGYFDFKTGNDNKLSMTSTRVFIDKIVPVKKVLIFSVIMLIISVLIGIYFSIVNHIILLFLLIGILSGILYSLPKYGFKKLALGDLSVFIIWSLIFLGSYVLQHGIINISILLVSFSIGILTVNILHANNWRDINDDKNAGVKTVALLAGEKGSEIYYMLLLYLPYILIVIAILLNLYLYPLIVIVITIPMAYKLTKTALNKKNINMLDMFTARYTLFFAITAIVPYFLIKYL